jgi:putative flippase GtrA
MLLKELSAFGVVGAVAFAVDIGLFQILYVHADVDVITAKVLSTLTSTTAAYVGHRYWSFSHRARLGVRRGYLVFAVINGLTLLLSVGIVALVRYPLGHTSALILQLANVVSIGLGTLIRFAAYRRWVFPAAPPPRSAEAPERAPAG